MATTNLLFHNRDILFCRDLTRSDFQSTPLPENFNIERYYEKSEATERLLKRLAKEYPEVLLEQNFRKRFQIGACLWCVTCGLEYIGYVWTLVGMTPKPWFFPLTKFDIYFFDALTLPAFRRRGLTSMTFTHLLSHYKDEGYERAYLETREWNDAIINLMLKHDFVRIGLVKRKIRGEKCIVTWWQQEPMPGRLGPNS